MKLVVGLGNPGEKYAGTRHNTGRLMVGWIQDKVKSKVKFLTPDTFMNKSGNAVAGLVKNRKDLKNLIVIYDDLDLPLGRWKISFRRSAGGHRGLESVIQKLKTEEFLRIRVGISPANSKGLAQKPVGEKKVIDFILGKFKPAELGVLKKESKGIAAAIDLIFTEGKEKAMSIYNK